MVYKDHFVAVIKNGGQILRESRSGQEDVIQLPFGSEYSVHLKNLSSTRAAVSVSIDNVDVLNGHRIVLGANEAHDLEGFMENGIVKNKFKFIQKTREIAEHRGDFVEDGIVKISYQFEKPTVYPSINVTSHWPYQDPWNKTYGGTGDRLIGAHQPYEDHASKSVLRGFAGPQGQSMSNNVECFAKSFTSAPEPPQPAQDEGITVKGSQTNIQYGNTYLNELFPEVKVITFKLAGVSRNDVKLVRPVTVRQKIYCSTCGRNNSSRNDFCTNCGTCLK